MTDDKFDHCQLTEAIERIAQERREAGFALDVQVPLYTFEIGPDVFSGVPFKHQGKTYTYAGRNGDKQKNVWKLRFVVSE